jgi:hypothetical protein
MVLSALSALTSSVFSFAGGVFCIAAALSPWTLVSPGTLRVTLTESCNGSSVAGSDCASFTGSTPDFSGNALLPQTRAALAFLVMGAFLGVFNGGLGFASFLLHGRTEEHVVLLFPYIKHAKLVLSLLAAACALIGVCIGDSSAGKYGRDLAAFLQASDISGQVYTTKTGPALVLVAIATAIAFVCIPLDSVVDFLELEAPAAKKAVDTDVPTKTESDVPQKTSRVAPAPTPVVVLADTQLPPRVASQRFVQQPNSAVLSSVEVVSPSPSRRL